MSHAPHSHRHGHSSGLIGVVALSGAAGLCLALAGPTPALVLAGGLTLLAALSAPTPKRRPTP
jgi:hypothetical protein